MRTDIITDKRQVLCKNSSSIGYSQHKARVGDFVFWMENVGKGEHTYQVERLGRMLGRITWTSDEGKCVYIVVAILHDSMHLGERWVKPEMVTRVYADKHFREKSAQCMRMFLGAEMRKRSKADLGDVRRCVSEGWSSFKRFDQWKEGRGL